MRETGVEGALLSWTCAAEHGFVSLSRLFATWNENRTRNTLLNTAGTARHAPNPRSSANQQISVSSSEAIT